MKGALFCREKVSFLVHFPMPLLVLNIIPLKLQNITFHFFLGKDESLNHLKKERHLIGFTLCRITPSTKIDYKSAFFCEKYHPACVTILQIPLRGPSLSRSLAAR